jgi:ribonuclease HI
MCTVFTTFQWIPSHVGPVENERAGQLAKTAIYQNTVFLVITELSKKEH